MSPHVRTKVEGDPLAGDAVQLTVHDIAEELFRILALLPCAPELPRGSDRAVAGVMGVGGQKQLCGVEKSRYAIFGFLVTDLLVLRPAGSPHAMT